jgi:hypothetical protein
MTSISLCHFPDDVDFGIIGSQRPQFIHATNGLPRTEATEGPRHAGEE